ncbi:MAG: hypothetical protein WCE54_06305 [Ignavibacteriaceae bacterium]
MPVLRSFNEAGFRIEANPPQPGLMSFLLKSYERTAALQPTELLEEDIQSYIHTNIHAS